MSACLAMLVAVVAVIVAVEGVSVGLINVSSWEEEGRRDFFLGVASPWVTQRGISTRGMVLVWSKI